MTNFIEYEEEFINRLVVMAKEYCSVRGKDFGGYRFMNHGEYCLSEGIEFKFRFLED